MDQYQFSIFLKIYQKNNDSNNFTKHQRHVEVHVHFACSKSEQQKGSCKHRIIYVQFKDILAEADTSSFCARKFGKTQKILIPFDSPVNFLL